MFLFILHGIHDFKDLYIIVIPAHTSTTGITRFHYSPSGNYSI